MSEFEPYQPISDPAQSAPSAAQHRDDPPPRPPYRPDAVPPPPPPRKSRSGAFFLGAFSGCLLLFVGCMVLGLMIAASRGSGSDFKLSTNKIAIIPIEGEILESREIIDAIHKYADSSMVKGIVMRINSPGGAIAPTQEIYSEILKVRRKSGKPIVASLDSVAASGGFYIASACDEIVANPGTITGSIGVILQWMDIEDLLKWAKLKPETITSGAMKAAGSPYRQLTDAERAYFQRIVLQLHAQFVKAVVAGRKGKISEADVTRIADGRVFTGEEAVALKLIDSLGNLDDAVRVTAKRAGVTGEPSTIYPRRRQASLLEMLTNSGESESAIQWVLNRRAARFLYEW